MVNVFYGKDENNLSFERYSIINRLINWIKIDFDSNPELINQILQKSLFEQEVVYIVDNASFFLENNEKNEKLVNSLVQSNKQVCCFINSEKIYPFNKYVKSNKVNQFNTLSKQRLVNEMLKEYSCHINANDLSFLLNYLNNNPFNVKNEIEKLILFVNGKQITKSIIESIIQPQEDNNIFNLIFLLLKNQKIELISLYEQLILNKHQPIELIPLMSNQLFNMKIFYLARKNGFSEQEIIEKLNINYYAQMNFKNLNTSVDLINEHLSKLYELEYNMKRDNTNNYLSLKFYLSK